MGKDIFIPLSGENGAGGPISAHLEQYYGIEHARIVPESQLVLFAAGGLDGELTFTAAFGDREIAGMHDSYRSAGNLPVGLTDQGPFVHYFRKLVGTTLQFGEIALKIRTNGPLPTTPLGKQREFERTVARLYLEALAPHGFIENPPFHKEAAIGRDDARGGRRFLRTAYGLGAVLANGTNGFVVQYAPSIAGAAARIAECQEGVIEGAALISPSYFGREVSRILTERAGMQGRVVYSGNGIMEGVGDLANTMAFDTERYGKGFAALIVDRTQRLPVSATEALHQSRALLAARGVIAASGASTVNREPGYLDITRAMEVLTETFGSPLRQHAVTMERHNSHLEGREALFINRR